MNTTALIEWSLSNQNMTLVNIAQQAVALLLSLLIFIKSYDFEACLASVRKAREEKKREKERAKLLKFQKMLELAKAGGDIDVARIVEDNDESSEEQKAEPVLKIAKKKKKVDSATMV